MYSRSPFAPTGASPPVSSLISDAFPPTSTASLPAPLHGISPTAGRRLPGRGGPGLPLFPSISEPLAFGNDMRAPPAIMIRKLPPNINNETLGSMLIFAGDLLDTEIIRSPYQEDKGFATAVARFRSHRGALEARQKLDGKPNMTKEANMIVEVHSGSMVGSFERRHTIEPATSRTATSSASSGASGSNPPPGGRSRFNSAFQSTGKVSPPLPTSSSAGSGDFPIPESSSHFQTLFSPQSPVANGIDDRRRVTGKAMINNDAVDDETGELLKDPVGYAQSGQQLGRRRTNPQIPVGRFASLSLTTSNGSNSGSNGINGSSSDGNGHGTSLSSPPPSSNGITSPRGPASAVQQQPPTSPSGNGMYPHHPHSHHHHHQQPIGYPPRPQYPPINPADQNPPCNTLYVGNLPINTAEDELKTIFSKQRGYKRLCFRTKQNGPMCFVEFEDISFATKALNELYGHPLSNSVKGGIRLSFSKNPLGVRSGQLPNGTGMPPPPPGALPNGIPGMYSSGGPHLNGHHVQSQGLGNQQSLPLSPEYAQQQSGVGASSAAATTSSATGLNPASASFSSVQGPPPGLGSPPGLMTSSSAIYRGTPNGMGMNTGVNGGGIGGLDGMFTALTFSSQQQNNAVLHSYDFHRQQQPTTLSGGVPPSMNASYGRDDISPTTPPMATNGAGVVPGGPAPPQRWVVGAAGAASGV